MAARKRMRLTDRSVRTASAGFHGDGDGLGLQVSENGARSWILRTKIQGKRREMGLGGWPTTTLREAREKALYHRRIARNGGDPIAERAKSSVQVPTFREVALAVHREYSPSWKNKKHAGQWLSTLERYAFPTLGESRVNGIRSEHLVKMLSPIWLAKPETARRVMQRSGAVLLWAKGHGHRSDSPTDDVDAARQALPKQNDRPKHHKSLSYEELPSFITQLRSGGGSDPIKLAFEFLILTATRTNEVLEAKWPEIDLQKNIWTIPEARMKARREHRIPLSNRCVEILREGRKLDEDQEGYLFPGTIRGKPLSDMVFLMTLRRSGINVTAHGFRSTFRVWCAEQTTFVREVAEAALAHVVKDATEAAYQRSTFFEQRAAMMADWGNFVTGQQPNPAAP